MGELSFAENREDNVVKRTSSAAVIILICICLFHIIHNFWWVNRDVLSWYPEKYYQVMYKNIIFFHSRDIIHSGQSWPEKFITLAKLIKTESGWDWGMVFYLYTSGINLIFGNTVNVSLLGNLPFFILLIISTFLIGKEVSGEKAGVLAAFLVSFYPGIYGMSRSYGVDFPLTAMVALCSYILIAKDLTKPKYALLFGLLLGLTLLVKITAIFFLSGPLVYIIYQHIRSSLQNKNKNGRIKPPVLAKLYPLFLIIAIPLLFLSLGWGSGRFGNLLNHMDIFVFVAFIQRRHFYDVCLYGFSDLRNLFFYAYEIMYSLSRVFFLLFCTGFLFLLRKEIKQKMALLLWAVVPYIIFTLDINKWGRYYFPAFPALALITCVAVFQLKSGKFKTVLAALIVVFGLVQFYDLSFGSQLLPGALYKHPDYSFSAYPPVKTDESKVVSAFIATINRERKGQKDEPRVLLVAPHGLIDYGKLEYIFQKDYPGVKFSKFFISGSDYRDCDYIIVANYPGHNYRPDIEFLKLPGYYGEFLKISYPRSYLSDEELAQMHDFFAKFKTVDSYFGKDLFFYLCKNTISQRRIMKTGKLSNDSGAF